MDGFFLAANEHFKVLKCMRIPRTVLTVSFLQSRLFGTYEFLEMLPRLKDKCFINVY